MLTFPHAGAMAAVLIVLACFAESPLRADNSTPKQTALSFLTALDRGDMVKARALSVGSPADLAKAKAKFDTETAFNAFLVAEKKQFGKWDFSPGAPLIERVGAATENIAGNSATLSDSVVYCSLVKGNAGWKVNLGDFDSASSLPTQMLPALKDVTQGIAAGRYATLADVGTAMDSELKKQFPAMDQPTPAPTPTPASSAASSTGSSGSFADAFFQAPYVSSGQLLKMLQSVRLVIKANPAMLRNVSMSTLTANATDVLRQHGLTVDMNAPFTITADARLFLDKFTQPRLDTDSGDRDDWTFKVYVCYTAVDLSIRTPSRHGNDFVELTAKVFHNTTLRQGALNYMRDMSGSEAENLYADCFRSNFSEQLEAALNDTSGPNADVDQRWIQSRWNSGQDAAMLQSYNQAVRTPLNEGERVFRGLTTLPVRVNQDHMMLNGDAVQAQWNQALQPAGFASTEGLSSLHQWIASYKGSMNPNDAGSGLFHTASQDYYADWTEIAIYDFYPVFPVNGKLYRTGCVIWDSDDLSTCVPDNNTATLDDLLARGMDNFTREIDYRR